MQLCVTPLLNNAALPNTLGKERSGDKNPKTKDYIIIDRTN